MLTIVPCSRDEWSTITTSGRHFGVIKMREIIQTTTVSFESNEPIHRLAWTTLAVGLHCHLWQFFTFIQPYNSITITGQVLILIFMFQFYSSLHQMNKISSQYHYLSSFMKLAIIVVIEADDLKVVVGVMLKKSGHCKFVTTKKVNWW